jgi:hypothetical protein
MKHHTICYPLAVGVSCLSRVGTCFGTKDSTESPGGFLDRTYQLTQHWPRFASKTDSAGGQPDNILYTSETLNKGH